MFEQATRRAFLRRAATLSGAAAATALLAACSKSDAETFGTTAPTTTGSASLPPTSTTAAAAAAPTTVPVTSAPAVATPSTAAPGGGAATTVSFSYAASDASGRVRNPFVAVWVEDESKALVALLGVWYSTRDAKYLRELTDFVTVAADVDGSEIDAVTGATRAAGAYRLQWDGTGSAGTPLTGVHTLWIEAAREHGPHSVTSGALSLGAAGTTTVPGNGELSDAVVTVA